MNLLEMIVAMEASGIPAEQIIAAIKEHETKKIEAKRAATRERVRKHREAKKDISDVTHVTHSECYPPSLGSNGSPCTPSLLSSPSLQKNPPIGGQKKVPPTRGSRLEGGWKLPTEWGIWAEGEGLTQKEILLQEQKFRDYWIAKAGAAAVKMDWQATWRNWIRTYRSGGVK